MPTAAAALAYFGVVFAAGFLLGTVRVLVVEARLGSIGAVVLELPVMLGISWVACGRIMRRWRVPARAPQRIAVGIAAFGLLMLAELGVSVLAFGRSAAEHVATYRTPAAQLGLAAQVGFASFPLLRLLVGRRPPTSPADRHRP